MYSLQRLEMFCLNYAIFGGRRWYQFVDFGGGLTTEKFVGMRGKERTSTLLDWIRNSGELLPTDRVLDLGSNAGIIAFGASKHVRSVTGVEIDRAFHRQASFVRKTFARGGVLHENVSLVRGDITEMLTILREVDVVFASKFLYHRNFNEAIEQFMQAVRDSNVRLLVVQGHDVQGEFGSEDFVGHYLEQFGFRYEQTMDGTSEYPIGLARRVN